MKKEDFIANKICIEIINKNVDFKKYFLILLKEGFKKLFLQAFLEKIFNEKNSIFYAIKYNKEIIGGFVLSESPLTLFTFSIKNIFCKDNRILLKRKHYKNVSCLIINNQHRHTGIGRYVFNEFFLKDSKNIFFKSIPEIRRFVQRYFEQISPYSNWWFNPA